MYGVHVVATVTASFVGGVLSVVRPMKQTERLRGPWLHVFSAARRRPPTDIKTRPHNTTITRIIIIHIMKTKNTIYCISQSVLESDQNWKTVSRFQKTLRN